MKFRVPEKLLMGVATAATQIEGGDIGSNWNDWYERGFIKDGTNPATGNDHWEKWRGDTEIMSGMGLQIYRFGIEWARIIPEEGTINEEAVLRYREELLLLREKGIRPLLTIHHFTNPMWFEKIGGFTKRENLHYYIELVELAARRFGDLCSDYITINEPNVYATNSFFFGMWPPAEKSFSKTLAVMENLA
ncbi:MAG: glycoside hydrolase family 1 protein, partial [Oscillospiraceae bacterium]|nr:glycoside hydrolase family 1 protein [Oscillospiraceae bacterium]